MNTGTPAPNSTGIDYDSPVPGLAIFTKNIMQRRLHNLEVLNRTHARKSIEDVPARNPDARDETDENARRN